MKLLVFVFERKAIIYIILIILNRIWAIINLVKWEGILGLGVWETKNYKSRNLAMFYLKRESIPTANEVEKQKIEYRPTYSAFGFLLPKSPTSANTKF